MKPAGLAVASLALVLVLAMLAPARVVAQQSGAERLSGISLSLDELKAQMFHVSAGPAQTRLVAARESRAELRR